MKARVHVLVSGVVQGVFFRHHTREMARRLGVSGWVRNLPDGRVEAVFEGEHENVEKMLKFCRNGPPGADVTDVSVRREDYRGEFSGFQVSY
ncbi:MAG: acylphosphatase [Candidatus Hadarchaeota archaeon]